MLYFDIGAYVGNKTAEYVSRGARVIAVEPNPDSYTALVARFEGNNQVVCLNVAVSDHVGVAELTVPTCNLDTLSTLNPTTWFTGRWAGLTEAKKYTVQVTTLDRLIADYGQPDFLKVDCEGHEEQVFQGLHSRIPCLSFEYRSDQLDVVDRCLRSLRRHGKFHASFSQGDRWFSSMMTRHNLQLALATAIDTEPDCWGDIYLIYDTGGQHEEVSV